LGLAILTAFALDALLLTNFGWSELVGQGFRTTLWVSFGLFWIAGLAWSARECRQRNIRLVQGNPDIFAEALEYYLKGDYYQAERVLQALLRHNVRDLEARLMLATLFRHTGRWNEALRQLETLARFEGASQWEMEIEREREMAAAARLQTADAA
jgi:lipopolysaccharide biosynthesis regulator YciM